MNITQNLELKIVVNSGLRILVMNIRSWSKHYAEFLAYLKTLEQQNLHPNIIVLTETWIKSEQFSYFTLEGYSGTICPRQDGSRSGGVIIFTHQDIKHTSTSIPGKTFQAISVIIETSSKKQKEGNIGLIGVYRDQRKTYAEFSTEFEITCMQNLCHQQLVVGDLNADLLNPEMKTACLNFFMSHGFESRNNRATRIGINKLGHRTKTCLDLYTR
jgi:exonuclease III